MKLSDPNRPLAESGEETCMSDESLKAEGNGSANAGGNEMDEAAIRAQMMAEEQALQRGQIVTGRVVQVDRSGALVDVNRKAEGFVPANHIAPDDELKIGDEIEVFVLKPEGEEGQPLLSKRMADWEKTWRRIQEAKDTQTTIQAMVKDRVKGGLIVDVGVDAFVPGSHVDSRTKDLSRFIGKTLPLKVIEVNRKRNQVICSHKLATEGDREKRKAETMAGIEPNKIVDGIVRRITDFGAFVDIGGVDGLLHKREMSWSRIDHPQDVLTRGQRIQVLILDVDAERERISLGLKQLLSDPWKKAVRSLNVGDTVTGRVSRLSPTGVFVQLGESSDGLEGFVPMKELSDRRVGSPGDVVSVGQTVQVRVLQIRPNERRLTLSLKQAPQEQEREEFRDFIGTQKSDNVTIGDVIGQALASRMNGPEGQTPAEPSPNPEPNASLSG